MDICPRCAETEIWLRSPIHSSRSVFELAQKAGATFTIANWRTNSWIKNQIVRLTINATERAEEVVDSKEWEDQGEIGSREF